MQKRYWSEYIPILKLKTFYRNDGCPLSKSYTRKSNKTATTVTHVAKKKLLKKEEMACRKLIRSKESSTFC